MNASTKRRSSGARNLRPRRRPLASPHLKLVDAAQHGQSAETSGVAAIMLTEVPGYAKLVRESKREAKRARAHFLGVGQDVAAHHGGDVVSNHGGGVRCVFGSAVLAVRAAAEIQRVARERTEHGCVVALHVAEVVRSENDLTGAGVQLASRMLSLATRGEVLMSGSVAAALERSEGSEVRSLGKFLLRGAAEPMEIMVLKRLKGQSVEPSDIWAHKWLRRSKRRGLRMGSAVVLMGVATMVELAATVFPVPDLLVEGALVLVLLDWLGPLKGLRF
jgi:class 3 adenylate cyclase